MQFRIWMNSIFKLLKATSSLVLTLEWMLVCLLLHSFPRWVKIGLFVIMWIHFCTLTGILWVISGDKGNDLAVTFHCLLKERIALLSHDLGMIEVQPFEGCDRKGLIINSRASTDALCLAIYYRCWFVITKICRFLCVILRYYNPQYHIFLPSWQLLANIESSFVFSSNEAIEH